MDPMLVDSVHELGWSNHVEFDKSDVAEIEDHDQGVRKGDDAEMAEADEVEMGEDDETTGANGADSEEDEPTPRPGKLLKKKSRRQYTGSDDSDDGAAPFLTPLPLRQKNWDAMESSDSESDEQLYSNHNKRPQLRQKETVKRKRDQIGIDASKKKGTKDDNKVGVTTFVPCASFLSHFFHLGTGDYQ
jgi:hypothetical protein